MTIRYLVECLFASHSKTGIILFDIKNNCHCECPPGRTWKKYGMTLNCKKMQLCKKQGKLQNPMINWCLWRARLRVWDCHSLKKIL